MIKNKLNYIIVTAAAILASASMAIADVNFASYPATYQVGNTTLTELQQRNLMSVPDTSRQIPTVLLKNTYISLRLNHSCQWGQQKTQEAVTLLNYFNSKEFKVLTWQDIYNAQTYIKFLVDINNNGCRYP
jgi:hypothetical protein